MGLGSGPADEAADAVVELYRRHAGTWARARGTELNDQRGWLERFEAMLARGATVLDVGCGTGMPIAGFLADKGHAVTGIDSSPELVARFRANVPGGAAEVADMRSLALGRTFGGIVAWDSLFHLTPDAQRLMFPVFRDHAGSAGTPLLFTSGPAFGEHVGEFEGEPLYHASLDAQEYRHLLDQSGFEVEAHVPQDPDCGGHTVWLARYTADRS